MATYDSFAAAFDVHAEKSAYNAHYDRPALLELLGPVDGLRVLDAGCGSGLYARELVAKGADVIGVDASGELVRLARQRNETRATFHIHDLAEPMTWAANKSFDDPVSTLRELHRVLVDYGHLLLSTVHPTSDWLRLGGSYFTDERVSET
jgi:2-polyprenyl-3-methyl-5-hydroxy-6-metoxy-1,4-benzoquinol methylase